MRIPIDALSEEALQGVIEAFVLREGTDYGHRDIELETKRQQVMRALRSGRAFLTFDEDTGTTNIVDEPISGNSSKHFGGFES